MPRLIVYPTNGGGGNAAFANPNYVRPEVFEVALNRRQNMLANGILPCTDSTLNLDTAGMTYYGVVSAKAESYDTDQPPQPIKHPNTTKKSVTADKPMRIINNASRMAASVGVVSEAQFFSSVLTDDALVQARTEAITTSWGDYLNANKLNIRHKGTVDANNPFGDLLLNGLAIAASELASDATVQQPFIAITPKLAIAYSVKRSVIGTDTTDLEVGRVGTFGTVPIYIIPSLPTDAATNEYIIYGDAKNTLYAETVKTTTAIDALDSTEIAQRGIFWYYGVNCLSVYAIQIIDATFKGFTATKDADVSGIVLADVPTIDRPQYTVSDNVDSSDAIDVDAMESDLSDMLERINNKARGIIDNVKGEMTEVIASKVSEFNEAVKQGTAALAQTTAGTTDSNTTDKPTVDSNANDANKQQNSKQGKK